MWFEKKTKNDEISSNDTLSENLENKLEISSLKKVLSRSSDIKFQQIFIYNNKKFPATLIYVDGMVNIQYLSDYILKPLAQESVFSDAKNIKDVISLIKRGGVYFPALKESDNAEEIVIEVLSGQAALFFEQCNKVIIFDVKGFEKRSITETSSENISSGAKDSFVETLNVNTAMVRRKIRSSQLIVEKSIIGDITNTNIALIYIEGIAENSLVKDIKEKLLDINILGILSPGGLEELLLDSPSCSFPQILNTERVDKFCSNILEGRVGIIIDGFPLGYVLPSLFMQFLQAPEDYSDNIVVSAFIRILRYFLMTITIFFPGLYISVTSFNPDMIPSNLANSISEYRTGVAFPTFMETILMLIAFEILLESGNRMPKNIGQAISVVGGLIVGEAAVNAKIVSPSIVIVAALTAIAGLSIPNIAFSKALRVWRFIVTIASSVFGLVGLVLSGILFIFCLVKLENFGVPYMAPLIYTDGKDIEDIFIRPSSNDINKKNMHHKSIKRGS